MKFARNLFLAVSMVSLTAGVAVAKDKKAKGEPNCEVKGKKSHVADEAACTKKGGKWVAAAAPASTTAPAASTAPADAAAPAAGTEEKK